MTTGTLIAVSYCSKQNRLQMERKTWYFGFKIQNLVLVQKIFNSYIRVVRNNDTIINFAGYLTYMENILK